MKVFLVAAEESGDRLGAALMRALRRQDASATFAGLGGDAMTAEGIAPLFPIHDLSIVGLAAIPRRLPMIFRRIRQTVEAVLADKPDVLVIIDSPDFTHRVARRVRKADPNIPIVDYVSPSVWAWRPGRARAMRRYVDHVLALLPFEPAAHARLGGPPCTYVGHPLAEQAASLRPDAAEARRRVADPPVLLVLPGSRRSEVTRLLRVFADAVALLAQRCGPLEIVIPTVPHLAPLLEQASEIWPSAPTLVIDPDRKRAAFRVARAALAKSGTVTLELAVAGVPTVAAYKVSSVEAAIARRVIQVPTVILANLVLGENVVPEFLQQDCTAESLATALAPLLGDTPQRRRQLEAFARLDPLMGIGASDPARRAAAIVLSVAAGKET
ncbi:MAG: lipid-A-disaccharide synthase [Pseudorhodoplanes sp.]|nr:lipid-A-disaccharide synthase [Pseudorhodoplanes sp.]